MVIKKKSKGRLDQPPHHLFHPIQFYHRYALLMPINIQCKHTLCWTKPFNSSSNNYYTAAVAFSLFVNIHPKAHRIHIQEHTLHQCCLFLKIRIDMLSRGNNDKPIPTRCAADASGRIDERQIRGLNK